MIQIRTICPSAHLDSFCRKLDELKGLEFCYLTDDPGAMRRRVGWESTATYKSEAISKDNTERAERCELLIEMLREPNLMEVRAKAGLPTVYVCERWFKPFHGLPGWVRLLVPTYWRMARRYAKLMDDHKVWFFPCGVHAVRDFIKIYNVMHGKISYLWRTPKNAIERELGGYVEGFPRMKLWAYFVAPSKELRVTKLECGSRSEGALKVLWVGRMLDWKRVDILIKAFKKVRRMRKVSLLLVGEGAERKRLVKLAGGAGTEGIDWVEGKISFSNYIPNDKVRELMREADVYVMPSNAEEGWGAAVSDALSEGCPVISTYEAGSSATLLDGDHLYHAKSVKELVKRLADFSGNMIKYKCADWSGEKAAEIVMEILK